MRRLMGAVVVAVAVVMLTACAGLQTTDKAGSCFKVMGDIQTQITWQVWNAKGMAASPVVVEAVIAQNKKGPIPGMDNAKWKKVPEKDAVVQGFINNDAAKFIKGELDKTNGIAVGAFLNAANGEKVAFTDKTGSYIHKGSSKFDVPFLSGYDWQGLPGLEDGAYLIQISTPVLFEGKPIGALVVEIDGSKLEALTKK